MGCLFNQTLFTARTTNVVIGNSHVQRYKLSHYKLQSDMPQYFFCLEVYSIRENRRTPAFWLVVRRSLSALAPSQRPTLSRKYNYWHLSRLHCASNAWLASLRPPCTLHSNCAISHCSARRLQSMPWWRNDSQREKKKKKTVSSSTVRFAPSALDLRTRYAIIRYYTLLYVYYVNVFGMYLYVRHLRMHRLFRVVTSSLREIYRQFELHVAYNYDH